MLISSVQLQNFRSFKISEEILLDRINVLIGQNNSGKTSILRALHLIQKGCPDIYPEVRIGSGGEAIIRIGITDNAKSNYWGIGQNGNGVLTAIIQTQNNVDGSYQLIFNSYNGTTTNTSGKQLPNKEPEHFVVPYLSRRKAPMYAEDVRHEHAMRISGDMTYLAAKLSRLSNPGFPGHDSYRAACEAILGFVVSAVPSANGQRPGMYLPDRSIIYIDQMGEGVPNIVTLLADLVLSTEKLFLIEEPENDLHPQALKALLDIIIDSSRTNQFVISTHSNIVVRHLASMSNSRLYNVTSQGLPPISTITEVENTTQARLQVLRDMGYSLSDFDLWDGWLFLEESSAERIIRDYLIPWFAPKLSRIRTIALGGATNVEPTFDDFYRLVRFTHLEAIYRAATWVRVDGDEGGDTIVSKLRERYKSWDPEKFGCFSKPQFEHYYPTEFAQEVATALSLTEKQMKRQAKAQLLDKVRMWLDENEQRGRTALENSAKEIIDDLKSIEKQLSESGRLH